MTPLVDADSRTATDMLLAGLRADRWRPAAWGRFLTLAARRSVHQARTRPRAAAEVTLVHVVLARLAGRRGHRWVTVSWVLAISHLGLLNERRTLGAATVLTLLRANLPAIGGPARWLPVLALTSDLADGRMARRARAETSFGGHADSLADAAFWTWYALRHEPSHALRAAALFVWAAPVALLTVAGVARGHLVTPPRPAFLRPAAAMQAVIATRALLATRTTPAPPDGG